MKINRWDKLYMDLAKRYAKESSCLSRQVGAIIVRNRRIVAAGYNGAPSRVESCKDKGFCYRRSLPGYKSGEKLHLCLASHAEVSAISQAARMGISIESGTIYVTTLPCRECAKLIINSGLKEVIYHEGYNDQFNGLDFLKEAGIKIKKLEDY